MIPILHMDHTCSINIEDLNRRQKRKISLRLTFSSNNCFQSDRRSNDNITDIKVAKIFNSFLFVIYREPNSEEIILFLYFIELFFIQFFIIGIIALNYFYNGLRIPKEWAKYDRFSISETFRVPFLSSASILMSYHMRYYNTSKLLYCIFFFILNIHIIFISLYYCFSNISRFFKSLESFLSFIGLYSKVVYLLIVYYNLFFSGCLRFD